MDDIKDLLKRVFVTVCYSNDTEFMYPTIRMSDLLLNNTVSSTMSDSMFVSFRESSHIEILNITKDSKVDVLNNSKTCLEAPLEQPANQIYNKITETEENKRCSDCSENRNKRLTLHIPKPSYEIVNDIAKVQTPDVDRNTTQLAFPAEDVDGLSATKQNHMVIDTGSPTNDYQNKQKQNRPIMGKNALLKKANIDLNDSLIVQDIILDKFNPLLNHYVSRMYQRKLSRSRFDSMCDDENYSDAFSTGTSYSPMSISSAGSSGFVFPGTEEIVEHPGPVQVQRNIQRHRSVRSESFKTALSDTIYVDARNPDDTANSCSVLSTEGTTFSEYDPEKFLKNAIGEVASLSGFESTKVGQKHSSTKYGDSSVSSADVSLLVSKLSSFYSSLKKGIRKKRSSLRVNQFTPIGEKSVDVQKTDNPYFENLRRELAIQNEVMFQVSKALVYCRSSKNFFYSTEHIEAEKILLVALITKEALIGEINAIEFNTYQSAQDPRNRGEIEISSIKFLPNEHNFDLANEIDEDVIKEFFLIVLTCGPKVLASNVLTSDEKGCLLINKEFVFKDLNTDFDINLAVYSMLIKDKSSFSQEFVNCPSPRRIFHFHRDSKKSYRVLDEVPYIKTSAFRLLGRCCIRNADLSKSKQKSLALQDIPIHSRISPSFTARILSRSQLNVKIGGFLTIGTDNEKNCTIWSRRWCVLENFHLKYWNYPSEESVPPMGVIDLSYCIDHKICLADRTSCARSRTLLVTIKNGDSTVKHLLSSDSNSDLEMWEKELNYVLRSLTTWNCMN